MASKTPAHTRPSRDAIVAPPCAPLAAPEEGAVPSGLPKPTKAKGNIPSILVERQYKPDQGRQIDALLRLLQGPRSTGALREGINEPRLGTTTTNSTADDTLSQGSSSADGEEPEHDRHRTPS